jgi:hypothetical protein
MSLRSKPLSVFVIDYITLRLKQRARRASRPRAITNGEILPWPITVAAKIQRLTNSCAYKKC